MAAPPLTDIVATYVGALCLGLYLAVFSVSIRWLLFEKEGWKLRKNINWIMLIAAVVLLALDITDSAVDLRVTIDPIVVEGSTQTVTWRTILICTNANVSALIADALLIYRCWVIYDKSRAYVIFPLLLWVGCIICTVLQACWQFIENGSLQSKFHLVNMTIGPGTVLIPFWGFTIVLNAYATSMIIYRIWRVTKEVEAHASQSTRDLRFVMRVLMESGFLYLVITIAHFAVWFGKNSTAIAALSAMNVPIIGIAFNLILIRTSQGNAIGTSEFTEGKSSIRFNEHSNNFSTTTDRRGESNSMVGTESV